MVPLHPPIPSLTRTRLSNAHIPQPASPYTRIFHSSRGRHSQQTQPAKAVPFQSTAIKYIKNSSSAFDPFNSSGPRGQRPASPAFAEVLASDGLLARAVDESTDEVEGAVVKVAGLFRSVLRECRSRGRAAPEFLPTVATMMHVEVASHPGWARVSLPSLSQKSRKSGWTI